MVVSGTKKRKKTIDVTKGEGDMANTEWRNAKGERNGMAAKNKLEMLIKELALEEKISAKRDNSAIGGVTRSRNRPVVHNTNGERPPKTHRRNQKNTTESTELLKEWRQYKSLKRLFSKLSSIYQFNLSRYKSVFLRK